MNHHLARLRLQFFCSFCIVAALTISFHFLPWRFVLPGYRFLYHGTPSLIAGIVAICVGTYGAIQNWKRPTCNWPWVAAIALGVSQAAFLFTFIQGPDVAVGRGKTFSPWGETPIEIPFDVRPLWAAYAAIAGTLISVVLSTLSFFGNRMDAE